MSYESNSVKNLTPETAKMIWDGVRNNQTRKAKVELDTFLGTVFITNLDWGVQTSKSAIGTETVIESLRDRWDALRESDINDEKYEKLALLEAEDVLRVLNSNCPIDIEVVDTKVDGERVGN